MEKFWKIFDETAGALLTGTDVRHERLKGTLSDVAPILWQHGALARLKKGRRSISCFMADIPQSPLAMRDSANVSDI